LPEAKCFARRGTVVLAVRPKVCIAFHFECEPKLVETTDAQKRNALFALVGNKKINWISSPVHFLVASFLFTSSLFVLLQHATIFLIVWFEYLIWFLFYLYTRQSQIINGCRASNWKTSSIQCTHCVYSICILICLKRLYLPKKASGVFVTIISKR